MADVWKIGQDVKADEFYEISQYISTGFSLVKSEILGANRLTEVCNEMSKTYDQIINDQNDYLVDVDTSLDELSGLESDLEAKIQKLEKEIEELLKKREDGTITEEEEAELDAKNAELNTLRTEGDAQITAKQDEITETTDKAGEADRKSKSEIATDYGNTAIEKGQPLSETQDKTKSFWRKLFGGWNQQAKRDAGKKLLEAGNSLLEQVNTFSEIDDEIAKKRKKAV